MNEKYTIELPVTITREGAELVPVTLRAKFEVRAISYEEALACFVKGVEPEARRAAGDAQPDARNRQCGEEERAMSIITIDVDELDEHGAIGWMNEPALYRALDVVRVHDMVRLAMAEAGITPYGIAYDQDERVLHLDIPRHSVLKPRQVAEKIHRKLGILAVVAPGVTVKVETL